MAYWHKFHWIARWSGQQKFQAEALTASHPTALYKYTYIYISRFESKQFLKFRQRMRRNSLIIFMCSCVVIVGYSEQRVMKYELTCLVFKLGKSRRSVVSIELDTWFFRLRAPSPKYLLGLKSVPKSPLYRNIIPIRSISQINYSPVNG